MRGDRVFLDTNIIVYAYDISDKEKHDKAVELLETIWESGAGVISTQVLQEFFVTVTKKIASPLGVTITKEIINDLSKWDIIVNNVAVILNAINIQQEHKFSFWDSMIIASAVKGSAAALLSEDFSDGQIINGVEVRNPFKLRI
jgi:predicted nucleic acid-binding protein